MKTKKHGPSTSKVRRDLAGGKRGNGRQLQREGRRVRRPDPLAMRRGRPDATLTGMAGLVPYGVHLRRLGVDDRLAREFDGLKSGAGVVYSMAGQLRLLMDAFVVGEGRVFGLEGLATDPLFVHVAGGVVPSLDTVYRDLDRFDSESLSRLEAMVAEHGLVRARTLKGPFAHLDIDTSVLPRFGPELECAVPGPNPKYRGRPSHHPIMARLAETDTIVGAQLRPGDTGLGEADVPTIRMWAKRAKAALRRGTDLCVRIDAGGDCAAIFEGLHAEEVFYLVKAHVTQDVFQAILNVRRWRTTDVDADGKPMRQIAELDFRRASWTARNLNVRVIAVRSRERQGKQLPLGPGFDDASWTAQVFLTNRVDDANDISWDYDCRAGIEPLIAELKGAWHIGDASSYGFDANHAVLLLKMLSHNLLDRHVRDLYPSLPRCRTDWRRRLTIQVPGRLSISGRRRSLHVHPRSPMHGVLRE